MTRSSKDLLLASKQYAVEHRWLSWWHLASTLAIYGALFAVTCLDLSIVVGSLDLSIPIRIVTSVLSGLVLVRLFILYHDFEHGAILKGSRLAAAILNGYGIYALNPRSIWNRSHDHHHKNNSKIYGASIGSYPIMTRETYDQSSKWERFTYRASRHWLTIACGYLTIFIYGMCLRSLMVNPKRHWDSALSLLGHAGLIVGLGFSVSWTAVLLAVVIPFTIASGMGAYLFYAQHNFPGVQFRNRDEWNYVFAALQSSSYIRMSRIMSWFTGNIGYHHVHHLNALIPFYRLPEAMADLEELQAPLTTSLRPRDVFNCLRLKLWETDTETLVPLPKA
jgi:omega-6 fatty acid desaturase (delta-12 desaturase)